MRDILCNGAMPVTPVTKELAVLGIVKLGADRRYGIRNHIYELALGNYVEDFEGGSIAKPVK